MTLIVIMEPTTKIFLQWDPNSLWRVVHTTKSGYFWTRIFHWTPSLPWKKEDQNFILLVSAGAKVLVCFNYFANREYLVQPNIVEYDRKTMSQPGFDLILSASILKELGIARNFWNKEIDTDGIISPMRDITKLSTRDKIERAWTANNSIMIHEPESTLEATQHVIKILDVKYEKANFNALVKENCSHLVFLLKKIAEAPYWILWLVCQNAGKLWH